MNTPEDRLEVFDVDLHGKIESDAVLLLGKPQRIDFSGGWKAVRYRLRACAYHAGNFTKLVKQYGDAPADEYRYLQDRELYDFFLTGHSVIESFCYATYAVASSINPAGFPLLTTSDRRRVSSKTFLKRLLVHWPTEDLATRLDDVLGSLEYREWSDFRNVLAHRVTPGRHIRVSVGAPPSIPTSFDTRQHMSTDEISLDESTTESRLQWLIATVNALMKSASFFISSR